jgi:hypothetical protein
LRPQAQRITILKDGHFAAQPFFIALTICPEPLPFYPDTFCLLKLTLPGKGVSFREMRIPFRKSLFLTGKDKTCREIRKPFRKSKKPSEIQKTQQENRKPGRNLLFLSGNQKSCKEFVIPYRKSENPIIIR